MKPKEAGFDGAKGFRIPQIFCGDFRVQLKRGKKIPTESTTTDFLEQLIWFMPDNEPPRLFWCNADDQWFELEFNPIDKP